MFDFIPIDSYYSLYINLALFVVLFTLLHTRVLKMNSHKNLIFIQVSGYLFLIFIILYIGQRPISNRFGDTLNYYRTFKGYQHGNDIGKVGDYGWHVFMKGMSQIGSIHTFFTLCAIIYIFPLYRISKEFFNEYWYYAFVMFIVSYSFWTYGVNGMRNGAGCSLFLWGICYRRKMIVMALFFFLATIFHKTLLLPVFAFLLTYLYNNPKAYFKGWLLTIPLSLVLGGVFITLFTSLGFGDDRLAGYLTGEAEEGTFSSTGFRWDFLFHSAFAVFSGWYFIFKRNFKDVVYFQLFNTYLICNGFWVLVIKANFSNRFAYLSWFMMAIVIIYPLLKQQFFKNQHFMIGKVMFIYFMFTYFMYYVYS